jgi:hypothetical protein
MFSGRASSSSVDRLYFNVLIGVLLTTILVGFSSADLADYYLRELRRSSLEDSEIDVVSELSIILTIVRETLQQNQAPVRQNAITL